MRKMWRGIAYEKKKIICGYLFIAPWLFGLIFFFLSPLYRSLIYAFQKVEMTPLGLQGTYVGFENFQYAIFKDPEFIRQCIAAITNLTQVPLILVYSLFVALALKDDFKGRSIMRAISFLPVIIGSGVLMQVLKEDVFSQGVRGGQTVYLFTGGDINNLMIQLGLNSNLVTMIGAVIAKIFDLTWKSGVQIMLFLAGLHSIPDYVYEAAVVEGAKKWEQFWKITLPLLTPTIFLNVIYSVIDSFTDYGNMIVRMIYGTAFEQVRYGYSSALSIMYFLMIIFVLGIVYLFIKSKIVYADD